MPKMPRVETKRGRECMKGCQYDHTLCLGMCESMGRSTRTQCMNQCGQKLEECYSLCLAEDTL